MTSPNWASHHKTPSSARPSEAIVASSVLWYHPQWFLRSSSGSPLPGRCPQSAPAASTPRSCRIAAHLKNAPSRRKLHHFAPKKSTQCKYTQVQVVCPHLWYTFMISYDFMWYTFGTPSSLWKFLPANAMGSANDAAQSRSSSSGRWGSSARSYGGFTVTTVWHLDVLSFTSSPPNSRLNGCKTKSTSSIMQTPLEKISSTRPNSVVSFCSAAVLRLDLHMGWDPFVYGNRNPSVFLSDYCCTNFQKVGLFPRLTGCKPLNSSCTCGHCKCPGFRRIARWDSSHQ